MEENEATLVACKRTLQTLAEFTSDVTSKEVKIEATVQCYSDKFVFYFTFSSGLGTFQTENPKELGDYIVEFCRKNMEYYADINCKNQ